MSILIKTNEKYGRQAPENALPEPTAES